jgi:hypothetical protein
VLGALWDLERVREGASDQQTRELVHRAGELQKLDIVQRTIEHDKPQFPKRSAPFEADNNEACTVQLTSRTHIRRSSRALTSTMVLIFTSRKGFYRQTSEL